jgi:hypothetical protein
MKLRVLAAFFAGAVLSPILLFPAWAALGPSWKKAAVTPIVICTYDQLQGFKPRGDDSPIPPTWKKEQVTPVALVGYQSVGGKFVPLHTDATIVPAWKSEAVTPWVEVVPDIVCDFVPKNAQ